MSFETFKKRNARMTEQLAKRKELAISRLQNRVKTKSPQELENSIQRVMRGGGRKMSVGSIKDIIWPYWFSHDPAAIAVGVSQNAYASVSQEAVFIWMSMSQTVSVRTGAAPNWFYTVHDPNLEDEANSCAHDLSVQVRDATSSRNFFGDDIEISQIGGGERPTVLPTSQLMLPLAAIECAYTNGHATRVYVPVMTFFGYRVHLDRIEDLLGTMEE